MMPTLGEMIWLVMLNKTQHLNPGDVRNLMTRVISQGGFFSEFYLRIPNFELQFKRERKFDFGV